MSSLGDYTKLSFRVDTLEESCRQTQADMSNFRLEMRRIESRSIRGESLLMEMQRDQRRMSKVIDSIAIALKIQPPPVAALSQDELEARAAETLVNSEEVTP